jgi:CelD/BcsL family acetyltransferase involved in cellulose biosynthesis
MLVENWQLLEVSHDADPGRIREAWSGLAARSLVPTALSGPEFLIPLLRHFAGAQLVAVMAGDEPVMVLPVRRRRLPPRLTTNWMTPLSPPVVPQLDRRLGQAALDAFLRWQAAPVLLRGIPAEGPFWDALQMASSRFAILAHWSRAALKPAGSFEAWFAANFPRKRRKEFRRLRARLTDRGELASPSLGAGDEVEPWIAGLLELEEKGWKGRRGTALRSKAPAALAFADICRNLHAAGKLRFWSLTLRGRTIASLFAVREGPAAWLGKIAYDEAFAKYSPGVQLVLDATEKLFAEGGISLVDSCAIPDHPMIDHLWRDRVAVADVLVAGASVGPARFAAVAAAERLRRATREAARAGLQSLTARRRS